MLSQWLCVLGCASSCAPSLTEVRASHSHLHADVHTSKEPLGKLLIGWPTSYENKRNHLY